MTDRSRTSRRRLLVASGSSLAVALAGCTGSRDDDETDDWEQSLEPSDWEDVDEIRLEGYMNGWRGVEPDLIAGVRNPSLLLFAGEKYEITWENGDGVPHNVAIRNDERAVVGRNRTATMGTRGETQTISFEATEAMHEYVCEPHPRSMIGYIHVED